MKIHDEMLWEKLSPSDGHYFFGYYDRVPWDAGNRYHLCLKAAQSSRLPLRGETAEVGLLERRRQSFTSLTVTRAWCHQQGAMTLWLKHRPGAFVYNDWDVKAQQLCARIYALDAGLVGGYSLPLYTMSPDGRWGASLNFARIPRRGYSYADAVLDTSAVDAEGDGVFLIDMQSGESHLALSYRRMFDLHPIPYAMEGKHIWLNHIIFNADSSKFMVLLRHCAEPHKEDPWPWQTFMYTANIDGSDVACPLSDMYWRGISHQIWGRTPHEVLVDANWQNAGHEYVVFDESDFPLKAERISRGMGPMGHLIFSPDGTHMLADTYAVDGIQRLALVDVASGALREIGRFRHELPAGAPGDARCDLHPRWSVDGVTVTVDSIHDGMRGVYCCQLP